MNFGPQKQPASIGRVHAAWKSVLKELQMTKDLRCSGCGRIAATVRIQKQDSTFVTICIDCGKEVKE